MANPFTANDPAKIAAQRERERARRGNRAGGGGGGGGKDRNNTRNRNRPGGGGAGVVGTDPTTQAALADPQAFYRGLLAQAGFDPTMQNGLGDFLNQQAATFQGDWNTYTTNPANLNKDLWDFVRETNVGVPDAYINAQNAQGGYVNNPLDWDAFRQRMLAQIGAVNPQARGAYDTGKQPGGMRYNLFT